MDRLSHLGRQLRRLLRAPRFADEQDQRAAGLANAVLWVSLAGPLLYSVAVLHLPFTFAQRAPLLVASAVPALGLIALRRGHLRATSLVLVATFLAVPMWGALDSGGIRAPSVATLFLAVLLAGQLLGVAGALSTTALSILEVGLLAAATARGWLPPQRLHHTDGTYAIMLAVELIACGAFAALAARLAHNMLRALRQEQRAARDASQYLAETFEASPDAITSVDSNGIITRTNRAHETLLGRPRSELVGSDFLALAGMSPADERQTRERFAALLAGQSVPMATRTLRRADGREVTIEVNPRLAIRSDGSRTVEVVSRDVSDRVAAERRRRELEAQLEDARRLEHMGQLAAGVAHDFNNLLTVILANTRDAADVRSLPPPERERWNAIRDAAERAIRLTRQLLTFARRQQVSPRLVDLARALREAQGLLTRLLPARTALDVDIAGQPTVRIDPAQLDQILVNLVANARDALPAGGQIDLRVSSTTVADDASRPPLPAGGYAVLTVADNGAGMDAATTSRVFEPFFTTKPAGRGTGLGLATVFAVAQQAGGHAFVRSQRGQGTVFEVYLPIAAGRAEAPALAAPPGQ